LFDYIENNGLFLSGEGRACGGPERMIREILRITVDGYSPVGRDDTPGENTSPALVRYGRFVTAIELLLKLGADLQAGPRPLAIDPNLQALFRQHLIHSAAEASGDESLLHLIDTIDQTAQARSSILTALHHLSRRARAVLGRSTTGPGFLWSDLQGRLGIRPE
ncbi:MAG: hypothetical protein AAF449_04530, partial [Myxococcota bacterium]